jgi:hypothetical protein
VSHAIDFLVTSIAIGHDRWGGRPTLASEHADIFDQFPEICPGKGMPAIIEAYSSCRWNFLSVERQVLKRDPLDLKVSPELSIRAQLVEQGGPEMWEQFMDELRFRHLEKHPVHRADRCATIAQCV